MKACTGGNAPTKGCLPFEMPSFPCNSLPPILRPWIISGDNFKAEKDCLASGRIERMATWRRTVCFSRRVKQIYRWGRHSFVYMHWIVFATFRMLRHSLQASAQIAAALYVMTMISNVCWWGGAFLHLYSKIPHLYSDKAALIDENMGQLTHMFALSSSMPRAYRLRAKLIF